MEKLGKLFAVSVELDRDSKWDFEEAHLVWASSPEEALAKLIEERCEVEYLTSSGESSPHKDGEGYYSQGGYDFRVVEVDEEALRSGEILRVYGHYNN